MLTKAQSAFCDALIGWFMGTVDEEEVDRLLTETQGQICGLQDLVARAWMEGLDIHPALQAFFFRGSRPIYHA